MGKWLYAKMYYGKIFDEANSIIETCDQNEAMSIQNAQAL